MISNVCDEREGGFNSRKSQEKNELWKVEALQKGTATLCRW